MDVTIRPADAGPMPAAPDAPADPARIRVVGPLHTVRFPDACARCGATARGTLRLEKMFRRTYTDAPNTYLFAALDIPFCDACRDQHARELPPVDPAVLRKLRWAFVGRCLPYVIPIVVLVWIIPKFVAPVVRSFRSDGLDWGTLLGLGILAFLGLCLFGFARMVLAARQSLIAPYAGDPNDTYVRMVPILIGGSAVIPGPPTSVLAAANFTDDRGELFDGERHVFTFGDPVFASQFAALNADRLWSGASPRARRGRWLRKVLLIALVLFGAAALVLEWWQG
jgi:hypothetical protein